MSDTSKALIFGSILRSFLATFEGGIVAMTDDIVNASIEVFSTIVRDLLPTPSKSHYTFNLRDLAKVLECNPQKFFLFQIIYDLHNRCFKAC